MITEAQWIEFLLIVNTYAKEFYDGIRISEKEILDEMLNRTIFAQTLCEDKQDKIREKKNEM